MAERPEYFPEWAVQDVNLPNTGNINKQRPKETLRTIGFDNGQEISAEEFNWMFNNMGQWVEFLEQEITVGISSTRDVNVSAGDGLQGGGSLAGDVTISMGTPSTITGSSTNSVSAVSHSHAIDQASTTQDGIVRLATDATVVTGTNTTQAATSSGVQAKLNSISVSAGNGLSGGGTIGANRTISMGTPSTITVGTTNSTTTTSHTHNIDLSGRSVSAGSGLTGGGNLGDNRTISMGTPSTITVGTTNNTTTTSHTHSIDLSGRVITAGDGLSGGGNLGSNRTLSVDSSVVRRNRDNDFYGDIAVVKSNAWLTLDSPTTGSNEVDQGAGLSIGESGYKGSAAMHFTYTGDGKGHIGGGTVSSSGIPQYEAIRLSYSNNNVEFLGTMYGNASGLTSLNASQLSSGSVPRARLGNGSVSAGSGLTGGGTLDNAISVSMGTPSTITDSSTNSVSSTSHSHAINHATTGQRGIVQLTDSVSSTSTTTAATPNSVKSANDNANSRAYASRVITAGDGLSGGGNLTANRTLSVDSSVVRTSRSVSAGSGLTGGGNLGANRTISMGTPGTISASTSNSVTSTSHTHNVDITGFFSGTNNSLTTSGYQKLPGGLIIQWGRRTSPQRNSPYVVNFPIPFPSNVFVITATIAQDGSDPTNDSITLWNKTPSSFTVRAFTGDNTVDFDFIAIGI